MMENVAGKKTRSRKRKRNGKNKRRVQRKLEVKPTTSERKLLLGETSARKDEPESETMEAKSFWENYQVSQNWQQRHSVSWWKSRCRALEHENNVLRQKIREEASKQSQSSASHTTENNVAEDADESESEQDIEEDVESFEFEVDKDMLNFLEQSIRHKIELKKSRESETEAGSADASTELPFVTGEARIRAKMDDARLLYGSASPIIMAMEAALQATVDRHKDRAKPNYWPNIPLKP